ncbi:MAG: flagellin lysine-N-methylase [Deltaproteobacteria bacterium]|nr:flagellin lysine-N-methylase [Deltaproteobacteria bacterium]
MQDKHTVLKMPAYLPDFSCIGPECEDHCCYGWDIIVDKVSYRRYGKLPSTGLGKRIRKVMRLIRKDPSDARYARFVRSSEVCPFLTPSRLCRIQAELGQDLLPDTCAIFPRHLRARQAWIDLSASMACPEIARRALENPKGIEILEVRHDPATAGMLRGIEPKQPVEVEASGLALRVFVLSLLKDRTHELWRRVMALGFLLEAVGFSDAASGTGTLTLLLDEFAHRVDSGEWMDRMENAPVMSGLQLQLVKRLHDEMAPWVRVKTFRDCAAECLAGLHYTGTQPFTDEIGRRYDLAFKQAYEPFFDHYAFMLENYLVNHVLHHDLGFHQGRRLFDDYVMMVLNFAMLKTYLIGMAARHGERMNAAMVTRLIYSFTKAVEPDARFRDYALRLLAQSGCADMMHLAVLIKN